MKSNFTDNGFVKELLASFRSDDLAALRSILAEYQHQIPFYDLPPRLYLVPDANCVLKDLDFLCRRRLNPVRSALEEIVDAGLVRLFAPVELEEEVRRHIPTIAANGRADAAPYFAEWDRFKKKIRFFHARDSAPVEIADPDDACYVRAARIIQADAVVTDDEVVLDSTTSIRPPVIHRELRQISRDEAVKWGVSVRGALLTILTGNALKALATSIYRKPKIGIPIAAVLGFLGFLYDRNAVKKTGTSVIREIFSAAGRGLLEIATAVHDRSESSVKSLESIGSDIGKAGKRSLEKMVHAILIHEARPIAEADIVAFVHVEGFNPWTALPRASNEDHDRWSKRAWTDLSRRVNQILRSDPAFYWTGKGWTTRLLYPRPTARVVPAIQPNARPTIAAPIFGMVNKDHKDAAKSKIEQYREEGNGKTSTARAVKPAAAKKVTNATPTAIRAQKLQGQYMGALKSLKADRAKVKAVAKEKGVAEAVKLAGGTKKSK